MTRLLDVVRSASTSQPDDPDRELLRHADADLRPVRHGDHLIDHRQYGDAIATNELRQALTATFVPQTPDQMPVTVLKTWGAGRPRWSSSLTIGPVGKDAPARGPPRGSQLTVRVTWAGGPRR